MGTTKYVIYLSDEEKAWLGKIIETAPDRTAMRAKILLASDFNNPEYCSVQEMSQQLGVSHATIMKVRAEYDRLGLEGVIYPKGTLSLDRRAIITEEKRNQIIALIHERPPYGQRRWTISCLCEELVKRKVFDYISETAIQRFLARENINLKKPNKQ